MHKKESKKLKEVADDPTYSEDQWQLYKDRLDDLNPEKQARLETLSQNIKDLQMQVARIKQTIEKLLDKDTSLVERICTLFCEQGITIISVLTAVPFICPSQQLYLLLQVSLQEEEILHLHQKMKEP